MKRISALVVALMALIVTASVLAKPVFIRIPLKPIHIVAGDLEIKPIHIPRGHYINLTTLDSSIYVAEFNDSYGGIVLTMVDNWPENLSATIVQDGVFIDNVSQLSTTLYNQSTGEGGTITQSENGILFNIKYSDQLTLAAWKSLEWPIPQNLLSNVEVGALVHVTEAKTTLFVNSSLPLSGATYKPDVAAGVAMIPLRESYISRVGSTENLLGPASPGTHLIKLRFTTNETLIQTNTSTYTVSTIPSQLNAFGVAVSADTSLGYSNTTTVKYMYLKAGFVVINHPVFPVYIIVIVGDHIVYSKYFSPTSLIPDPLIIKFDPDLLPADIKVIMIFDMYINGHLPIAPFIPSPITTNESMDNIVWGDPLWQVPAGYNRLYGTGTITATVPGWVLINSSKDATGYDVDIMPPALGISIYKPIIDVYVNTTVFGSGEHGNVTFALTDVALNRPLKEYTIMVTGNKTEHLRMALDDTFLTPNGYITTNIYIQIHAHLNRSMVNITRVNMSMINKGLPVLINLSNNDTCTFRTILFLTKPGTYEIYVKRPLALDKILSVFGPGFGRFAANLSLIAENTTTRTYLLWTNGTDLEINGTIDNILGEVMGGPLLQHAYVGDILNYSIGVPVNVTIIGPHLHIHALNVINGTFIPNESGIYIISMNTLVPRWNDGKPLFGTLRIIINATYPSFGVNASDRVKDIINMSGLYIHNYTISLGDTVIAPNVPLKLLLNFMKKIMLPVAEVLPAAVDGGTVNVTLYTTSYMDYHNHTRVVASPDNLTIAVNRDGGVLVVHGSNATLVAIINATVDGIICSNCTVIDRNGSAWLIVTNSSEAQAWDGYNITVNARDIYGHKLTVKIRVNGTEALGGGIFKIGRYTIVPLKTPEGFKPKINSTTIDLYNTTVLDVTYKVPVKVHGLVMVRGLMSTTVKGTVKDYYGKPVEGLTVKLVANGKILATTKTNKDGTFTMNVGDVPDNAEVIVEENDDYVGTQAKIENVETTLWIWVLAAILVAIIIYAIAKSKKAAHEISYVVESKYTEPA